MRRSEKKSKVVKRGGNKGIPLHSTYVQLMKKRPEECVFSRDLTRLIYYQRKENSTTLLWYLHGISG